MIVWITKGTTNAEQEAQAGNGTNFWITNAPEADMPRIGRELIGA